MLPKEDNSDYIIKSGRDEYLKSHIPGAIFIDLQKELSIADESIRFKFPSKDIFLNFLENIILAIIIRLFSIQVINITGQQERGLFFIFRI